MPRYVASGSWPLKSLLVGGAQNSVTLGLVPRAHGSTGLAPWPFEQRLRGRISGDEQAES
jgi:hypothetical protein